MINFLNALFLAGLAAAALPILIHLFSKRKAKDIPFSSLEYLKEISIRKVRRLQLRQFLLLALRVLIIACFALAMSRPALRGSGSPLTRGSSTVAILLDNSFSMSGLVAERLGDLPAATQDDAGAADRTAPRAASETPSALTVLEDGSLYERAKLRAIEVLDLMGEQDQGWITFTGRPVQTPFRSPVANHGLLRQEVTRTPLAATPSDLPSALEEAVAMFSEARTINKELFIISDFQQKDLEEWIAAGEREGLDVSVLVGSPRDWHGSVSTSLSGPVPLTSSAGRSDLAGAERASGWVAASGLESIGDLFVSAANADSTVTPKLSRIPEDVRVYLVQLREDHQENLSVSRVRFDPTSTTGGVGRVLATVKNHGTENVTDRIARLYAGGGNDDGGSRTLLADATFGVPALGEIDVELAMAELPEQGSVEVVLGADPLEWDNHAYLVTSDPGVRRVLLVSGDGNSPAAQETDPATGLVRDPSRYLAHALDPLGKGRFFQFTLVGPDALADASRLDTDLVVLSDVGRISEPAVENLVRFRSRGGGIFIALGDRVDLRYYNTEILNRLAPAIEFRNTLQEGGSGSYRSLRPAVIDHPIFQGFPLSVGDDLSSARFRKIVEVRAGEGARVLAHFGSELPALIEEDGLVVLTTSLDGAWNDFVTSASFLPVVHRTLQYLTTRTRGERGPRLVGDPIETTVSAEALPGTATLLDPLGGRTPVDPLPADGGVVRLRTESSAFPGIYRFVDGAEKTVARIAVNLDGREGNLAVSSADQRSRYFGRNALQLSATAPVTREALEGRYGREIWRELLIFVLLLLALETLLARGRLLS